MSSNHFGGNMIPEITREEHEGASNAKRIVLVGEDGGAVYSDNHICTDNTSTTPLGAGATFTGVWQDCLQFQEVNISVATDQNSATNGLVIEWSADGSTVGDDDKFTVYANAGTNYTPNPAFRYVRVKYTNGTTPQTSFSLMTILRRRVTGGSFHRIDSTLKDDSDARLNITIPKLKTAANTYVSQTATTAGNAKVSIEELETNISDNNKTQLKTSLYDSGGDGISIESRKQTPTGNALNVQIGPGDVISNIPVTIDFDHHQIHEGETYKVCSLATTIGTNTVKYGISVPTIAPSINGPHMIIGTDVYNGSVRVDLYAETTLSGGVTMASYNRNRNVTNVSKTAILANVTAVNGTLINSFYAGAGSKSAANNRAQTEWVLKSAANYRVDVVGLSASTDYIQNFDWYEDLGV